MTEVSEKMRQALRDKLHYTNCSRYRRILFDVFESLASYELQIMHWVNSSYAHSFSDIILYNYFDTITEYYRINIIEEIDSKLNFTLYDKEEAQYLQRYCKFVFNLINSVIGFEKPDAAYYKHPEWPRVVHGAIRCRKFMAANNLKHKFWSDFDKTNGMDHQFLERDRYFLDMDVVAYMHGHWPNWQVPK